MISNSVSMATTSTSATFDITSAELHGKVLILNLREGISIFSFLLNSQLLTAQQIVDRVNLFAENSEDRSMPLSITATKAIDVEQSISHYIADFKDLESLIIPKPKSTVPHRLDTYRVAPPNLRALPAQ